VNDVSRSPWDFHKKSVNEHNGRQTAKTEVVSYILIKTIYYYIIIVCLIENSKEPSPPTRHLYFAYLNMPFLKLNYNDI